MELMKLGKNQRNKIERKKRQDEVLQDELITCKFIKQGLQLVNFSSCFPEFHIFILPVTQSACSRHS